MASAPDQHSLDMLTRKLESITHLSDEDRQAILKLPARTRVFKPGYDLVRDGDKPSQCCLILDGWACRYKIIGGGKRQIFSFHVAGDVPDLQSLHLHTMDHSLATMTETTIAFLPHESVRELILRYPGVGAVLWRDTLIDAAIFREWMVGIGRRTAHGRIAHLLCELYLKLEAMGLASEHRCFLPITQVDIADALGLSNVHVNRVLKDMRGRGLITLQGRTLAIEKWDELARTAEFDPTYLHLEKRAA